MENVPPDKKGRSDLPSELGFALAPRETDPTPVVTRSSEVSRVEPTSTMVTRSRARELALFRKHNSNRIETRPEQEIQVSMSTTCEGGLEAAGPFTTDTVSQYT